MTNPEKMLVMRAVGILSLAYGLGVAIVVFANRHVAATGGRDLSVAAWPAVYALVAGLMLIGESRIGLLLVGVPILMASLWSGVGSIFRVPFPFVLINLVVAAIGLLIAYGLIHAWGGSQWIPFYRLFRKPQ